MRGYLLVLSVLLALALGCAKAEPPPDRVLRVAAASDLKFALEDILAEFRKQHAATEVSVTYGSSGNFYAQLVNKAPFDIYFSADIDYPNKLIGQSLALPESKFHYALGQIVLWVPNDSTLDLEKGLAGLADPSVRKIAIANPEHAPYGRAAVAALEKTNVYKQVKPKLVLGENVSQAAQFVETKAADAGIIALSLAMAPAMKEKGQYVQIPPETYPPLEQGGIITAWTKNRAAAETLRVLVISDRGREILAKYGFAPPGE